MQLQQIGNRGAIYAVAITAEGTCCRNACNDSPPRVVEKCLVKFPHAGAIASRVMGRICTKRKRNLGASIQVQPRLGCRDTTRVSSEGPACQGCRRQGCQRMDTLARHGIFFGSWCTVVRAMKRIRQLPVGRPGRVLLRGLVAFVFLTPVQAFSAIDAQPAAEGAAETQVSPRPSPLGMSLRPASNQRPSQARTTRPRRRSPKDFFAFCWGVGSSTDRSVGRSRVSMPAARKSSPR